MRREELERAIESLQQQRARLGDDAVDIAVHALRERLRDLDDDRAHERRLITTLFADVSGFTAMSETMDPEDVSTVMNDLWTRIDRAIIGYGGRVDKHMGDAVMALWGADRTNENDAAQAVRAALAMQDSIRRFNDEVSPELPIRMRVGINTGHALVGWVGTTREFSAIGDAVNTASRLESAARVGGILISRETEKHVRGLFELAEQPSITVKGKSEPLRVFSVGAELELPLQDARRGVQGTLTSMVGRDGQLLMLEEQFNRTVELQQARGCILVGEAGLGKSRLILEFRRRVGASANCSLLTARGSQESAATPYAFLRMMMTRHLEISDSDAPDEVERRFAAGFGSSPLNARLVGRLLGFGLGESPALDVLSLVDPELSGLAVRELALHFQRLATDRPLIIVAEDLHWIDEPSLELLAAALERSREHGIFMVASARPGFLEDHELAGPPLELIRLAPLEREEVDAMIHQLRGPQGALPAGLMEIIQQHSEGNPFYVEEFVKMVDEEGLDERSAAELGVPTTLEGVLLSRLDALGADDRTLVRKAAVVGRVFWDDAVAAGQADTDAHLGTLEQKQMIFTRSPSLFAEAREFSFRHSLLRDVAYESILLRERPPLHRSVAEWLIERTGGREGEFAGIIAWHFGRARDTDRERLYLYRSAVYALAQGAVRDAVATLDRALELCGEHTAASERFDILLVRERAHDLLGRRDEQEKDLDELTALVSETGGSGRAATVELRRAALAEMTGAYEQEIEHARRTVELWDPSGAGRTEAEAYYRWGRALWRLARYDEALEMLRAALERSRDGRFPDVEANARRTSGGIALLRGDLEGARRDYDHALEGFRSIGDRRGEAAITANMGIIRHSAGDYQGALDGYEQARSMFAELGDRRGEARALFSLGDLNLDLCKFDVARRNYDRALDISREIRDQQSEAWTLAQLSLLLSNLGDHREAERYAREALEQARQLKAPHEIAHALTNMAGACAGLGRLTDAEEAFREAVAMRRELGERALEIESLSGLLEVETRLGHTNEASTIADAIVPELIRSSPDSAQELIAIYLRVYHALRLLNDERAAELLRKGHEELQSRASRIADPREREAFLRRSVANRELASAWRESSGS